MVVFGRFGETALCILVALTSGPLGAGWLIDQAGLRSARVGAAMVSALHANYLINTGTASADEVTRLARLIKSGVRAALGVELREEVSSLGFPAEPPGVS